MKRKKYNFEDEQDIIIKGKFDINEILNENSTYKNGKLRLKVRLQRCWYDLLAKRDEHCYRRQRAKRGYSDYDVWDIQLWLIHTLRPMLENIIENLYSHPAEITFEEWKGIIEEMIFLLKIMDWDDEIFVRKNMGISTEDFSLDTFCLVEAERKKARDRFMELFNKWFWTLSY